MVWNWFWRWFEGRLEGVLEGLEGVLGVASRIESGGWEVVGWLARELSKLEVYGYGGIRDQAIIMLPSDTKRWPS